jgi:arginine/lysine/histidine transporter system substrate-binding protein
MSIKQFFVIVLGVLIVRGFFLYYTPQTDAPAECKVISTSDVITIGTSADYPPFSFVQEDQIIGFDIDVAQEVAHRLDKKATIKNIPFDALMIEAQRGSIDIVAAGMTTTPEREKKLFFTKPHLTGDSLLIIAPKKGPVITSVQDLRGKETLVNEGYVSDMYLTQHEHEIPLIRLETVAEAFMALQTGRGAAFVTAKHAAQPFFDKYGTQEFYITPIANTTDSYSLAITKKKPKLFQDVQLVLNEMEKDGTLPTLKKKWGLS